jgi:hypothetical protein
LASKLKPGRIRFAFLTPRAHRCRAVEADHWREHAILQRYSLEVAFRMTRGLKNNGMLGLGVDVHSLHC